MRYTYRDQRIEELYQEALGAYNSLPSEDRTLTMSGLKGKFSSELEKGNNAYFKAYHKINQLVEMGAVNFPAYLTLEQIITKEIKTTPPGLL